MSDPIEKQEPWHCFREITCLKQCYYWGNMLCEGRALQCAVVLSHKRWSQMAKKEGMKESVIESLSRDKMFCVQISPSETFDASAPYLRVKVLRDAPDDFMLIASIERKS